MGGAGVGSSDLYKMHVCWSNSIHSFSTYSGNPELHMKSNIHWNQTTFSLQCRTVRYKVRQSSLIHSIIAQHGLHVAVLWELLFLMTASWQGQVNITKVFLTYSSVQCHLLSTYSFSPSFLCQLRFLLILSRVITSSCFKRVFTTNFPIFLKWLFYRNEGLKESRCFGIGLSKISCLKIRKITFKKSRSDLETKWHVSESRKKN